MDDGTLSRRALVAITLMRIFVGWHFLYEGIAKLTSPSWSAAGYLRQARGPFAGFFRWLASQPNLLGYADYITMWGLTLVGVFLILGLFTRLASLAGIAFVLLFYVATPPFVGYFYSIPTEGSYLIVNKNLVELGALLVIFVTRSGLFAGLDRILHGLFARRPRLAEV
ncbi:MAG TPA: DoxX family protein [Vicinamibacterales bacterium]|jgi:thiosulfate dehydrogenase [quinone] large subunit|nr:DoxX family protein [Vicinamibacterales bacterium]